MKFCILSKILGWCTTVLFAQQYAVFNIPPELLKHANVIKRYELRDIQVKSASQARVKHTVAYTILNDKGEGFSDFTAYYDKFTSIDDIEGKLYDATGKELKKVKKKDISDMSGTEGGMSITDDRYKNHSFYHRDYPYTVEYTSVIDMDGMFWLPGWVPQVAPFMGVQESKLVVTTPAGYNLRYKAYNFKDAPTITNTGSGSRYEWVAGTMAPKVPEPFMPGWSRERAYVALAPTQFQIEGISGSMTTWKEFGSFMYKLTQNRDQLPEPVAAKVKQLVAGVTDPYKKIDILYRYLQDNTRYISIQLGIGGWQPIPAAKVAQSGYGDCKALTNYMAAMLRETGINSKYALINSGDDGLYTDASFVSNQFDHVILCVPMQKDTVWLECTNNILPAGYLGSFTYNRPALLVDESGGTLVYTPTYKKNENLQQRKVNAIIDASGNLKAKVQTTYTGLQQDALHNLYKTASKEDIMKAQRRRFDLSTYDIDNYEFKEQSGRIPQLHETIDLSVNGYAQVSGKRLFLVPNVMTRSGVKLTLDSARVFDVELDFDYLDTDTVHIQVPEGYEVESLPKPVKMQNKFGAYQSDARFENNEVIYTRAVQQNNGRYPAADYKELVDFYQTIQKADRVKMVLRKKE